MDFMCAAISAHSSTSSSVFGKLSGMSRRGALKKLLCNLNGGEETLNMLTSGVRGNGMVRGKCCRVDSALTLIHGSSARATSFVHRGFTVPRRMIAVSRSSILVISSEREH